MCHSLINFLIHSTVTELHTKAEVNEEARPAAGETNAGLAETMRPVAEALKSH